MKRKQDAEKVTYGLPKMMTIAGKRYSVIFSPEHDGGMSNIVLGLIDVGTNGGRTRTHQSFLHEVLEVILVERGTRYQRPYNGCDNGDYRFVMDHAEFENVIKDLCLALIDILPGKLQKEKA
jgi:hypothetical protein